MGIKVKNAKRYKVEFPYALRLPSWREANAQYSEVLIIFILNRLFSPPATPRMKEIKVWLFLVGSLFGVGKLIVWWAMKVCLPSPLGAIFQIYISEPKLISQSFRRLQIVVRMSKMFCWLQLLKDSNFFITFFFFEGLLKSEKQGGIYEIH